MTGASCVVPMGLRIAASVVLPAPHRLSLHSINSSLASHHGNEMGRDLPTLVDTSERRLKRMGTLARAGSLSEAAGELT